MRFGHFCNCLVAFAFLPFLAEAAGDDVPDGASVPFVTHEAEAGGNRTTGRIVKMTRAPGAGERGPEVEASGRGYVELAEQGQYLEFPGVEKANAIVVRHCIPDAPMGGGTTATLSLYVNGEKRQVLSLSSFHNWLYAESGSNNPSAGRPFFFWDESRCFIKGGVKKGDTIKLQKDEGDAAGYYRIDLIDLEDVPAALPPPREGTYLSVTDFGATGDGKTDDAPAIAACIAAAKAQKKVVWIPAGTYCVSERFGLDGVAVQGAGMWHTNVVGTEIGKDWEGQMGFDLQGSGAEVRDLSFDSAVHSSRGDAGGKAFTGKGTHWRVENVWITHTNVGLWMSGASNGVVRGCRVCCTYADGINLNLGACHNLVENCFVRGVGDDGIALLADAHSPVISSNNTVRHNTVIAPWWGANCDLAGGSGHLIERNYFADSAICECVSVNLPPAYPMYSQEASVITHNTIVRGGGNLGGQERGAIWTYTGSVPMHHVVISRNRVIDSIFHAVHLSGGYEQELTVSDNFIDGSGGAAIYIGPEVKGSGKFMHNEIAGLKGGVLPFQNGSRDFVGGVEK